MGDGDDNRSTATLIHKIERQNKSKESDGGLSLFPALSNRFSFAIKNDTGNEEREIGNDSRGALQCLITPQIQCVRSVSIVDGQRVSFSLPDEEATDGAKYQ